MHGETRYGFIISLDAQGSGTTPDPDRPGLRARIYQVAEDAFDRAGISDARLAQEDRGDGILAVVEPRRTEALAGEWVEYLHQNLRQVNRELNRPLRLRAGLNVGPFTPDGQGFSGAAVDLACRIGNCPEAKAVLAAAPHSPLLVAVTEQLYRDVVRHGGRWIEPDHYRQYHVPLREGDQRPWFTVPGRTAPPPLPGREENAEPPEEDGPPEEDTGRRDGAGDDFRFGTVTHYGSGQVLQGKFGDLTFDRRRGGADGSKGRA
ncbi:hypothetical protein [Streptomyces pini]|uniref:Guanylate cyclase domain-containing protein n=1 Tax=Streptomyces pini TaxID=1520580 RepID=A0A1I3VG39_9ACTN|nr:hypothetical protein [Streptomyces pini]SFJ94245.1 hypothetical protein SAMN05192584_102331 [Streptomyces pini]